jgi:hypothetical protein
VHSKLTGDYSQPDRKRGNGSERMLLDGEQNRLCRELAYEAIKPTATEHSAPMKTGCEVV